MELQELALAYLQNQSNETLTQILLLLKPFIRKKAFKLSLITKVDQSDLEQEMYIVVMNRLKSYDPTKGKFLTYLINTTKGDPTGTMSTLVCKKRGGDGKKNFASNISLSQPINTGTSDKEITLEDTVTDGKDFRDDVDISLAKDLLKTYSETEVREILKKEGY
jgi:hypothetical protein